MPKVCPVCGTNYPDANVFCLADGATLRAAELAEDLIGGVVADRYLITDLLGEGGMGKVYLARHVRLPQQAAIKVLRADMVRDAAAVARFNREASNASRIDDDRVARVYDFGETSDGTVYLAMEYVKGRTLRTIITESGSLSPRRTASIIQQIGGALDAAHALRIIHRDLKPDNVLIIEGADGKDRVKVVDFGIAKAFGADEGKLTKTGFVVGTPEFMSPEQLLGESLDARSDVYALGLLAFQCLTGTLPFPSDTPDHGMTARLLTPARPLLAARADAPSSPELQAAFDTALARLPADRPASAGAFADLLSGAIDETWPDTTSARARATPAIATAAVADAPIMSPPRTAAPAATPPAPAPPPIAPPARRSLRVPIAAGAVVAIAAVALYLSQSKRDTAPTGAPPAAPTVPAADSAALKGSTTAPATPAPAGASTSAAPAAPRRPVSAPRDTPTRQRPRDPDAPPPTGRTAATNASDAEYAAEQALDSLGGLLRNGAVDAATARRVAAAIRGVLPRLARDVRTRAHLKLIEAETFGGNVAGACDALNAARAAATTARDRAEVRKYEQQLGCG